MVSPINPSNFPRSQNSSDQEASFEFHEAKISYQQVMKQIQAPLDRHAEIGVITTEGICAPPCKIGINEEYGAHRVGSVTKTFTAFLALKLCNKGVFPNGLQTRVDEFISEEMLGDLFEDPEWAKKMTLEELLSHTSGLEEADHCTGLNPKEAPKSLTERFDLERKLIAKGESRKYQHIAQPGDNIFCYSNGGYAVVGWMIEVACNQRYGENLSFSEIMRKEIFQDLFHLSEKTEIKPGPSNDCIQSAAGDLTTTVQDLQLVGKQLQEGNLDSEFGIDWQEEMLKQRGLLGNYGLGCTANLPFIQHCGMNREFFETEERDVTSMVCFPLRLGEPGVVAMCDSGALGPQGEPFINAIKKEVGLSVEEKSSVPQELDYFCPPSNYIFRGNSYVITENDPFGSPSPQTLLLSRNGMKHSLERDSKLDGPGRVGYLDQGGEPWFIIKREDGSKVIYSGFCSVTQQIKIERLKEMQPGIEELRGVIGRYEDERYPAEDHPVYLFSESGGRLYFQELGVNEKPVPCLYVPSNEGEQGVWVPSTGRKIQFQFPEKQGDLVLITDVLTNRPEEPRKLRKVS